jgi:hypothetical protein
MLHHAQHPWAATVATRRGLQLAGTLAGTSVGTYYFGHFMSAPPAKTGGRARSAGRERVRSAVAAARRVCRTKRTNSTAAPEAMANPTTHVSRRCGMCKRLGRDCSFA